MSPSIGIAVFPRDGASADTLIRNADAAMYLAKDRGRSNFQFFSERLSQTAFDTLSLETRLREAIREEAFELHYQPQVRVDTGRLVGVEALIRWPQKDGPPVMPNDFIPIAEQRGLIMPIGAWVLRAGLPPEPHVAARGPAARAGGGEPVGHPVQAEEPRRGGRARARRDGPGGRRAWSSS